MKSIEAVTKSTLKRALWCAKHAKRNAEVEGLRCRTIRVCVRVAECQAVMDYLKDFASYAERDCVADLLSAALAINEMHANGINYFTPIAMFKYPLSTYLDVVNSIISDGKE